MNFDPRTRSYRRSTWPFPGCPSAVPLHSPTRRASGASRSTGAAVCAGRCPYMPGVVAASRTRSHTPAAVIAPLLAILITHSARNLYGRNDCIDRGPSSKSSSRTTYLPNRSATRFRGAQAACRKSGARRSFLVGRRALDDVRETDDHPLTLLFLDHVGAQIRTSLALR